MGHPSPVEDLSSVLRGPCLVRSPKSDTIEHHARKAKDVSYLVEYFG